MEVYVVRHGDGGDDPEDVRVEVFSNRAAAEDYAVSVYGDPNEEVDDEGDVFAHVETCLVLDRAGQVKV